jgi:CHAT domain-containing protein
VLEYWLGNTSAAVLWLSATQTGIKRWPITSQDRDRIASLPSVLADPQHHQWRELTQPVASQLLSGIPPLADNTIRHVQIVPDGALARIPFEALPFDESTLLIERFAVSYSPSARMVPVPHEHRGILWPWQLTFEAFADPSPGAAGQGIQIAASRGWQRLPEAAREVAGISRILGGKADLHIGPDARKDLLDVAVRAPVLHFATHAFADLQNPDLSYILLAPASPSRQFDYLFQKEVYALRLYGVKLVTLSACETDVGKLVPGEGVENLSQAFLAVGASSVVTSLWSVGDRPAAELMLRFYSRLSGGDSKEDALRHAKLEFLASPSAAHPAYWAAFILTGSGGSRLPLVIRWTWLAGAGVLAIGLIPLVRTLVKKARRSRHSRRLGFPRSERMTLP